MPDTFVPLKHLQLRSAPQSVHRGPCALLTRSVHQGAHASQTSVSHAQKYMCQGQYRHGSAHPGTHGHAREHVQVHTLPWLHGPEAVHAHGCTCPNACIVRTANWET